MFWMYIMGIIYEYIIIILGIIYFQSVVRLGFRSMFSSCLAKVFFFCLNSERLTILA